MGSRYNAGLSAFCHPENMSKPEPLAFPCDAIPESGFSWEDFIFGANILSDSLTADVLRAQSFASVFRKPLHELFAHISQKYISQWFLQSTWDNFAHLHESGKLYAPSPDRQTDQFCLIRFCKTSQRMALVFYVDGFRKASEACDLPSCSCSSNPGRTEPWPSNPEHLLRAYMKVLQEDCETAKTMGIDAIFTNNGAYKKLCCAMDKADNPRGLPIEWPEPAAPPLSQDTERCVCM